MPNYEKDHISLSNWIMILFLFLVFMFIGHMLTILSINLFGVNFGQIGSSVNYQKQIIQLKNENKYLKALVLKYQKSEFNNVDEKYKIDNNEKLTIDVIIKNIINHEGIYDNDPEDSGGVTIYGITRTYNPLYPIWIHFDELKKELSKNNNIEIDKLPYSLIAGNIKADKRFKELAIEYYKNEFYRLKLNKIKYVPLASYIFDMHVNLGESQTATLLNIGINSLNRPRIYGDLKTSYDDNNKISEIHIKYINAFYSRNKARSLLNVLKHLRSSQYIKIANNYKNRKFLNGWLKRASL